ncbi:MAG: HPP family protein [Paucibacter sp.]|nr:HPP family protein [Roseateles sp.]
MSLASFLVRLARDCWPARVGVDGSERLRAMLGGLLGILFTALVSRSLQGSGGAWIVAPLGASAVLVFAVPASPLAQPWSVIGGNSFSALIGAACAMYIPDPAWAGSVAVGLAIAIMFTLRCLHPPGGAAALLSALGAVPLGFALFPVAVNCLLLVAAGMLYNGLTGRRYPHGQGRSVAASAPARARFSAADLDAALAHYNQVIDIPRDDLEELLHHAEAAAYQRSFGTLSCAAIMTREPLAVAYGTPLAEAWALLERHHVKALPVVDRVRRVIGILTLADFVRHAPASNAALGDRIQALLRPRGRSHSDEPETVGQIMSTAVRTVGLGQRVSELVPLYTETGHHHLPVVDGERRLVGIVTQSDVIRALNQQAGQS